jgi:hypothetical protein
MDLEVLNLDHEVYIEVRDRDPLITEMIGHCRLRVGFFVELRGREEFVELFYNSYPAGRILLRGEYWPQAVVTNPPMMPVMQ